MTRKRMLPHTITLFNYIGDNENGNEYAVTIIKNVMCMPAIGTTFTTKGDNSNDYADLYIFENNSIAYDIYGNMKTYLPAAQWNELKDKTGFWTLNERDYFVKGIFNEESNPAEIEGAIVINSYNHFDMGTLRMRHWEINGR